MMSLTSLSSNSLKYAQRIVCGRGQSVEYSVELELRRQHRPLELAWLGMPLVGQAGHAVIFRTRKALALLIYLSVEAGVDNREKVVALFWPESDSPRGRGMLRTTLSHLREALSPVEEVERSFLVIETQALGFHSDSNFVSDLQAIQEALAAIQRRPAAAERGRL